MVHLANVRPSRGECAALVPEMLNHTLIEGRVGDEIVVLVVGIINQARVIEILNGGKRNGYNVARYNRITVWVEHVSTVFCSGKTNEEVGSPRYGNRGAWIIILTMIKHRSFMRSGVEAVG